jgi:phospholipid transport system transporter-binding protein
MDTAQALPAAPRAAGAFRLVPAGAGGLAAEGPLTFATARHARALGASQLAGPGEPLAIDGAGITASDSAGLAVLLDWLAMARHAGRRLRYAHLPQGLMALARISEVEQFLERGV